MHAFTFNAIKLHYGAFSDLPFYLTYQKSFGAPSHVTGVKQATAMIIQMHVSNMLLVRSSMKSAISSTNTIVAPYNVTMTHTGKQNCLNISYVICYLFS